MKKSSNYICFFQRCCNIGNIYMGKKLWK